MLETIIMFSYKNLEIMEKSVEFLLSDSISRSACENQHFFLVCHTNVEKRKFINKIATSAKFNLENIH